jgi:hypothetical protein
MTITRVSHDPSDDGDGLADGEALAASPERCEDVQPPMATISRNAALPLI